MPFTPTHTLAVLPAARWLPFSALAIGSMIPDLPLYYDMPLRYETTHTFAGLITACLPLGLLAYVLFHALIKRPVVGLLPDAMRARLETVVARAVRRDAPGVGAVVLAVLFGALTHIVWDAFTHEGRWGVQAVALLDENVDVFGVAVPGYALFQHGASLIGLPLLAWLGLRWLRSQPPSPVSRSLRLPLRLAIAALLLIVPTLVGLTAVMAGTGMSLEALLFRFVTLSGGVFMLLVLVYGVVHTALAA